MKKANIPIMARKTTSRGRSWLHPKKAIRSLLPADEGLAASLVVIRDILYPVILLWSALAQGFREFFQQFVAARVQAIGIGNDHLQRLERGALEWEFHPFPEAKPAGIRVDFLCFHRKPKFKPQAGRMG